MYLIMREFLRISFCQTGWTEVTHVLFVCVYIFIEKFYKISEFYILILCLCMIIIVLRIEFNLWKAEKETGSERDTQRLQIYL